MPVHKVTQFLSEFSTFFKKSDSDHAMFTFMDVIKGIKMNEQTLFGSKSRCNNKYSLQQVFQLLLVCMDYENIGELFRKVNQDSNELTISERVGQAILEFVVVITKVFSIVDEKVMDALVNESDELVHICELYQGKKAS